MAIVQFEARRDQQGRISVYRMPAGDGGGSFEVAGINERYHPGKATRLKTLIMQGSYQAAEKEAAEYIIDYTSPVEKWLENRAVGAEFYLRDTYFNAGPGGAARVLQMAVGTDVDGKIGPKTKQAVQYYLQTEGPAAFLDAVHKARWSYMENKSRNKGKAQFWKGWQNRMNKALAIAKTF